MKKIVLFVIILVAFAIGNATAQPPPLPHIKSVLPVQNASNVPASTGISVFFDTEMDGNTINNATFVVSSPWARRIKEGTYGLDLTGKVASFDPIYDFKPGEVVSVVLTTGIKSAQGVGLDKSFAWKFTVVVGAGGGTFVTNATYPLSFEYPYAICAADFDNDGDIDLAATDYNYLDVNQSTVAILFNNDGLGGFGAPVPYDGGDLIHGVSAADFNGDDWPDMVTANGNKCTITILMNDGAGAFGSPTAYPTGGRVMGVTVGDLDGDGDMDVATAGDDQISVLMNVSGTFPSYVSYVVGGGAQVVQNVVVADFNGNGFLDLATGDESYDLKILLNNTDGTFGLPQSYWAGASWIYGLTTADFNNDGHADVVTTSKNELHMSVMTNRFPGPPPLFELHSQVLWAGQCDFPVSGDINADGYLDLFIQNRSNLLYPYFNRGDATFKPCSSYYTGHEPWGVAVADFDGDGDLDVAVSNAEAGHQEVNVLFNVPPFPCDSVPPPPEVSKVVIPNKVYERFGFGHWDYLPEQDPEAGDNCIVFDEACPGWAGINPGDFFEIPIILRDFSPTLKIGGFELEVDFDYIDLTFYGAERGGLLEKRLIGPNPVPWQDDIFWSWEYFSYRVLPCPTCACCKYKILLYGQAEMPDGPERRGYCISSGYAGEDSLWWYMDKVKAKCPDGAVIDSFATLAWLKFQVANNELLRDLKLPIVFEWEAKLDPDEMVIIQDWDCAENTFSNCDGSLLYVSKDSVLQYDPHVCPYLPTDQRILNFVDGGVHICSPCTAFTCVRGDINMDKVPYSTADAVLFANYFVHGLGVFTIDRDAQVCATDINADGRTLMLADLIYLIRVIQKDAVEFPKLGPSSDVANLIVSDGRITVECASAIGGILFKFDGNVTPTLLNANMELLSNEGNVLVWSGAGNSINAGASQLLNTSGAELVSVIAVDREGRDLATTINAKVTPTTFALHPAYPNPFNPNTNLSFTLPNAVSYSMNIYNVAGQLVRSYEDMGNVGLNVITWDGKDNAGDEVASGIYFYKLIAGQHQATRKMVILK